VDEDQQTRQAIEALAELYLTGPDSGVDAPFPPQGPTGDAAPSDPADTAPGPVVEAVFVGHLPGFAAPWLSQYADRLSTSHGPTVVAHVDADDLDLEVVQANPERKPHHLAVAGQDEPPSDRKLEDVLAELGTQAGSWLMHLGDPVMPLVRRLAHRVEVWTILTGADEAALVAAYQMLKKLLQGADSRPQRVQLMFMGCDPEDAEMGTQRIRAAAQRFLNVPIVSLGARRQMQPVLKTRAGSYAHEPDAPRPHWQVLSDFIVDLRSSNFDRPERRQPERTPQPTAPPIEDRKSTIPDSPTPDDLAGFVDDLQPLEARSPLHGAVQLALDSSGRLHLMIHAWGKGRRAAVADLVAAGAWAKQHATLLGGVDHRSPALHLFVDQPKSVKDLLATGAVHVHLLIPVTVGSTTTWHHVELN
jgi:hypothetical protein